MNERFLSVVIPVYNEASSIAEVIQKVAALGFVREVVVVDDGSNDGTTQFLKGANFGDRVRIFFHSKNQGKGAALRTGFKEVAGDIVAIQDADLEYPPEELLEATEPIRKGLADVVYGSRFCGGRPTRMYLFWHKIGNQFLTFVTNLLYNTTLTDMETGRKVFARRVLEQIEIQSKDFSVEPELTAKICKKGFRVYEVPVSYYGRSYAEGKKITWKHGFGAIWTLLKYRFTD